MEAIIVILIRGVEDKYARQMIGGKIGLRDLLSTIINTCNTGYKFSGFDEKHVKDCILWLQANNILMPNKLDDATCTKLRFILDDMLPHFYITYFHILNEHTEKWLVENFSDDAGFFYIEPKINKASGNFIGENFIGRSIDYIGKQSDLTNQMYISRTSGIVSMIQFEIGNGVSEEVAEYLCNYVLNIYRFLFSRVVDGKFTADENEYRIIYKVPTTYDEYLGTFVPPIKRKYRFLVDGQFAYEGERFIFANTNEGRVCNVTLSSNSVMIAQNCTNLIDLALSGRKFELLSDFANIDIRRYVHSYGYIGSKNECMKFVKKNRRKIAMPIALG